MASVTTTPVTPDSTPEEIDRHLINLEFELAYYRAIDSDRYAEFERASARAEIARIEAEIELLHQAYLRRRWTRWYFVPGGHLHSEGVCSSLYASTDLKLTPRASGATTEQAVELYGWRVCTLCVPDAPTWPAHAGEGTAMAAEADKQGVCLNKTPMGVAWRGAGQYGACEACGARGLAVTSLGNLRRHSHQRKAEAAARQARLTDPKLIGTPDGAVLYNKWGMEIRTLRSAEMYYVEAVADIRRLTGPYVDELRDFAARIGAALAAKRGVEPGQVEALYEKRIARKLREFQH